MSLLYSLLTVAGTASLAFGGNTKDRLSYSENKHDYPSPSRDEWPSKKWASHKYDKPSGHAYGNRGPRGHDRRYGKAYSMHGDDYSSSKQWKRPSYSSKDSKDSSEWKKGLNGVAYSMHEDDDEHYDVKYHSSKQWKSPSKSDSASSEWKKDSDDYVSNGHAYTKRSIPKQTYGNAYSMHKDEEPKANWKKPSRSYGSKKSQWAKHDEPSYPSKDSMDSREWKRPSKHSRDWKKDGDDYGRAYSLKGDYDVHHNAHGWRKPTYGSAYYMARRSVDYDSKKPQWAKDEYEPKHDEKEYPSKDEPKHEPSKYDEPKKEDDDHRGTAWAIWDTIKDYLPNGSYSYGAM